MLTLIMSIFGPLLNVINKFLPDQAAKDAVAGRLGTIEALKDIESAIGPVIQNYFDSKSNNVFGRWRDLCGWICTIAFGLNFLIIPIANAVLTGCGSPIVLPMLDSVTILPLLTGLLGLGTLHHLSGVAAGDSNNNNSSSDSDS